MNTINPDDPCPLRDPGLNWGNGISRPYGLWRMALWPGRMALWPYGHGPDRGAQRVSCSRDSNPQPHANATEPDGFWHDLAALAAHRKLPTKNLAIIIIF